MSSSPGPFSFFARDENSSPPTSPSPRTSPPKPKITANVYPLRPLQLSKMSCTTPTNMVPSTHRAYMPRPARPFARLSKSSIRNVRFSPYGTFYSPPKPVVHSGLRLSTPPQPREPAVNFEGHYAGYALDGLYFSKYGFKIGKDEASGMLIADVSDTIPLLDQSTNQSSLTEN